jgi:hypothetical protein
VPGEIKLRRKNEMQVEILKVSVSPEDKPFVRFANEVGQAWAYWSGDTPRPGEVYAVELSISKDLFWDEDIVPVPDAPPQISGGGDGEQVTLQGILAIAEDDGYTLLQFGSAGSLMLSAYGDVPPIGTTVQAKVDSLTLFDTRI